MTKQTNPTDMFQLAYEGWRLWYEASTVITLRMMRLAQGGAIAQREATRMVEEKWSTAMLLGPMLAATPSARSPEGAAHMTMKHYQTRVSANKRRLSR